MGAPTLSDVGYTPGTGAEIAVDTGSIPGSVVPVSDIVVDGQVVSNINNVPLPVNTEATSINVNGQTAICVRDDSLREGIERTTIAVEALLDIENASPIPLAIATAPTGIEQGLVVRNIPSGTQSVSVTDGTHGPASVTAASTAAVATNLAQVVALHPTSPIPTGTNTIGPVNQGTAAVTAATEALIVAASPNSPSLLGYDANGTAVGANLVTQNGTVQVRTYDETNRLLLEQILLVLVDIRTTLVASNLKNETVSLSSAPDFN
jgi:hypothetical protein